MITHSPLETAHYAAQLAMQCRQGDCLLLRGDLGVGKTVFARGFIQALCPDEREIVSPTFTLVQCYQPVNGPQIWHFDLYRLKQRDELVEIGLDEALQEGISLVEWPELAGDDWPDSALDVEMRMGHTPDARIIAIRARSNRWSAPLEHIKDT